jgi:hypothetical protein
VQDPPSPLRGEGKGKGEIKFRLSQRFFLINDDDDDELRFYTEKNYTVS